jgi:predicted RNA-binding Zn-ribbon protein involved in translation (DUF1610 family)
MGIVVVKCPLTGRPFSTGIQVEREDFETLQQDSMTTSRCPHCGQEHIWWTREARCIDGPLPTTGLKIKSSAEPQLAFGESALSLHAPAVTRLIEG